MDAEYIAVEGGPIMTYVAVALIGALLLGGTRQSWWSVLLLAISSWISDVALRSFWWLRAGVFDTWLSYIGLLFVAFCCICGMGWVLGRLARRLIGTEQPAQS